MLLSLLICCFGNLEAADLFSKSAQIPMIGKTFADSIIGNDGSVFWYKGSEEVLKRYQILKSESELFGKIVEQLSLSEYPFYVRTAELKNSVGEFSSLRGELHFDLEKMKGFLFDAALIEEFVHAYQSLHYGYSHGQCRKRDYIFALNDCENEVNFRQKMERGFLNWRRFGEKHAYIESEAKLIVWLIQHQSESVSYSDIFAADMYNSGGAAAYFIGPYLNRRNCRKGKKKEKLKDIEDRYIDMDAFMTYQRAFIRHWKLNDYESKYVKGRFRHRPEALQRLLDN